MDGIPLLESQAWILSLSAIAGAVHMIAPDHWLPASVLSWRRGWRAPRALALSFVAFGFHVVLGAGVYFLLASFLRGFTGSALFTFGVVLVFSVMAARVFRFARIREVLGAETGSPWAVFVVVSLLGPAESLVPILVKSGQLGAGYLAPTMAFFAGTLVSGMALVLGGRWLWNRPMGLPRGLLWAQSSGAVFPVIAGLALGLGALMRL